MHVVRTPQTVRFCHTILRNTSLLELKKISFRLQAAFIGIIRYEARIFGVRSRYIKDLNSKFKSSQKDRISKKQKNLIKKIIMHQIYQWDYALL